MTAAAPSPLHLTAILAAAPAAWAALTGLAWALVPLACREDIGFTLHLATGAEFLVAAGAPLRPCASPSEARAARTTTRGASWSRWARWSRAPCPRPLFAWSFVVFLDPCLTT